MPNCREMIILFLSYVSMVICQSINFRLRLYCMRQHKFIRFSLQNFAYCRRSAFSSVQKFEPQIGLEIHAQLGSSTKLFSDALAPETSAMPINSAVAYLDMALPGTLPRLNRKSVEQCILAAVLLNCEIADYCRFDRKHYFYPDLPLGYQITQKSCPIAKDGYFDFYSQKEKDRLSPGIYKKRVRIQQIQLEMDSGKTLRSGAHDLIDLNRSGISLVEIVTAPDLSNAIEALLFVEQLRQLFIHNGICAGQLHEGHMRIDVNISVNVGNAKGERTELKNVGSVKSLRNGIEDELNRQIALLEAGEEVKEETRAVNFQGQTVSARTKGSGMDYRFVPEPNLPSLKIDPNWVESAKQSAEWVFFYHKCILEHGFSPFYAIEIMKNKRHGAFIREYLSHGKLVSYVHLSEWMAELNHICRFLSWTFPPSEPAFIRLFAEIISLNEQKKLTKLCCIELLRELGNNPCRDLTEFLDSRQVWQIHDPIEIRTLIKAAIEENAELTAKARAKPGSKQFVKLRRTVVDRTRKRIDLEELDRVMLELLEIKTNAKSL